MVSPGTAAQRGVRACQYIYHRDRHDRLGGHWEWSRHDHDRGREREGFGFDWSSGYSDVRESRGKMGHPGLLVYLSHGHDRESGENLW